MSILTQAQPDVQTLVSSLAGLPPQIRFVPCSDCKRPIQGKGWQKAPQTLNELHKWPQAKAVGAHCGDSSGGLLAVDHDGASADQAIEKLSGLSVAEALPKTVTVTSGKEGRYCAFYFVPEKYWDAIATKKIKTGFTGPDGKEEQLELRWSGLQQIVVGVHPDTGSYKWVVSPTETEIAEAPMWIVEAMLNEPQPVPELLLARTAASPTPSELPQRWKNFEEQSLPIPYEVPLDIFLGKKHRELIANGVGEGGRNDAAIALACNIVGTENYLKSVGQSFSGNGEQLYREFCKACSPELPEGEIVATWKSAQKRSKGPCVTEEKLQKCAVSWTWKNIIKPQQSRQLKDFPASRVASNRENRDESFSSEQELTNQNGPLNSDQTIAEVQKILTQDLPRSQRRAKQIELRKQSGMDSYEFSQLWSEVQIEFENEGEIEEQRQQLEALLQASGARLSLGDVLPADMAKLLNRMAVLMGTSPEGYLTVLLPTVASLIHGDTRLDIFPASGFEAKAQIFTGLVGSSGSGKSPVLKAVQKPIRKFQKEADELYEQNHKAWQKKFDQWNATDPILRGDEPEEPQRREYYLSDATTEAIAKIQNEQKGTGFSLVYDELAGLFKGQNQYKSRGNDGESLLSARDGTPIKIHRASGKRISCTPHFSITGGIQRSVLHEMLGNYEDANGQWARFLWCLLPESTPRQIPNSEDGLTAHRLNDKLTAAYKHLESFKPQRYHFSPEAQREYCKFFREMDDKRCSEHRQSMRSVFSKAQKNLGEIALILHLFHNAHTGVEPAPEISLEIYQAAEDTMRFFLSQVEQVQSWGAEASGELEPVLAQILQLAERKDEPLTAKMCKNYIFGLRKVKPDVVRVHFKTLSEMGYGQVEGMGSRLKFSATPGQNGRSGRSTVDPGSTAETLDIQGLQRNSRSVDRFTDFSISQTTPLNTCPGHEKGSTDLPNGQNLVIEGDTAVDPGSTGDLPGSTTEQTPDSPRAPHLDNMLAQTVPPEHGHPLTQQESCDVKTVTLQQEPPAVARQIIRGSNIPGQLLSCIEKWGPVFVKGVIRECEDVRQRHVLTTLLKEVVAQGGMA